MNIKVTGNKINNVLLNAGQMLLTYMCMMVLSAAMVGTIFVFFDIKWGWCAFVLTLVETLLLTIYTVKKEIFKFSNIIELLLFCVLELIVLLVYIQYAPTIELRQDPSLYMFKALNLVNYGYTYKPMPFFEELINNGVIENLGSEYAVYQNGTRFIDGNMHTDFFPGGVFVYAMIGKINKKLLFLGQTLIIMVAAALLFFALKKLLGKKYDFKLTSFYVLAFFLSPVIVFFGRGSFSESMSLAMLLFVLIVLADDIPNLNLLMFGFLVLYSSRMDFMIVSIIGVFVLTYYSWKRGLIYSVLLLIVNYIYNDSYFIYSTRIRNDDMKILKYTPVLIVCMFVISCLICCKFAKLIDIIYNSKIIKYVFLAVCILILCFMFRDNIGYYSGYEMATIHEQYLMTYEEFILDLLFLVFPSILIVGGIFVLYDFFGDTSRNKMVNIFIILIITVYLYFLVVSSNSPQLYWFLRRYIYVVLPIATISFVVYLSKFEKKVNWIIATYTLFMGINLFLNSHVGSDYQNLNFDTDKIEKEWEENDVEIVLYDDSIRYKVSPLMVYSNKQVIPVNIDYMDDVCNYLISNDLELDRFRLILSEDVGNSTQRILCYEKQYEAYGKVPDSQYIVTNVMYEYTIEEYMSITN